MYKTIIPVICASAALIGGCVAIDDETLDDEILGEQTQELNGDSGPFLHPLMKTYEDNRFHCTFWGPTNGTETRYVDTRTWTNYPAEAYIQMFVQGANYSYNTSWTLTPSTVFAGDCSSTAHTRWQLTAPANNGGSPITCTADARRLPGEPDRLNLSGCSNGYSMECIRIAGKNNFTCDSAACNFASCGTSVYDVYDIVD